MLSCELPRCSGCYFVTCNSRNFKTCSACYVATSVSSIFHDVLHATLQQPFQATSKTFCMLRSNNRFKQLPPCSACYVATSVSSIFQDEWILCCKIRFQELPPLSGSFVVTSISNHFRDALDATL